MESKTEHLAARDDVEKNEMTPLLQTSPKSFVNYIFPESLLQTFGSKLLVLVFLSQHLLKGLSYSFVQPCEQYIYASYHVPASKATIFAGVTALPWSIKPVIGLISDSFPIWGFNKAPYMIAALIAGIYGLITVGLDSSKDLSLSYVVTCLVLVSLQYSVCDLLTEAKCAESVQLHPARGPDLLSFMWIGISAGNLVSALASGTVISALGFHAPFLIVALPSSLVLVAVFYNYLDEHVTSADEQKVALGKIATHPEIVMLCILTCGASLLLLFLGILVATPSIMAPVSLCLLLVIIIASSVVLRPEIAKVFAFMVLSTSLSGSVSGASFYFFTDTPSEYPGGPHFSKLFYNSVMPTAAQFCQMIGVWIYKSQMQNWNYRRVVMFGKVVGVAISCFDIILFTRFNQQVGIPDTFFALLTSAIGSLVSIFSFMSTVVITSQLCPKGMEATVYALIAGTSNLGNTISANWSSLLLEWLECQPQGANHESLQFNHLWLASLLCTLVSAFSILLIPLIPDAQQNDNLLRGHETSATAGSLWHSCRNSQGAC